MIVLDTSALIDFFRGVENTREFMDNDVTTTVVTYYEISQGSNTEKPEKKKHSSEGSSQKLIYSTSILKLQKRQAVLWAGCLALGPR
jgi:predicted nucleic acid-binding protein